MWDLVLKHGAIACSVLLLFVSYSSFGVQYLLGLWLGSNGVFGSLIPVNDD